jgi:hypothetical protein
MKRRTVIGAAASLPLLSGCIYPDLFEIALNEEVQFHDGSMV